MNVDEILEEVSEEATIMGRLFFLFSAPNGLLSHRRCLVLQEPDVNFNRGDKFRSFTLFEKKLKEFQEKNYCLFTISKSEASQNEDLKYKYVKYNCKHFGERRHNPKLTGERAVQK